MEADKKILNKFVKVLKAKFDDKIRSVILFGSRAKGLAKPGSDYDLVLILAEKERKIIDEIYDEVLTFLIKYGVDISLKIYSEEAIRKRESMPTSFMMAVKNTGVELWTLNSKR